MPSADPLHALAVRLRALRRDAGITQRQLAEALSTDEPASPPLISSWESLTNRQVVLPTSRVEAYARFFATSRSNAGGELVLVELTGLTADERARYDELLHELTDLRTAAAGQEDGPDQPNYPLANDFWRFPPGEDVTIVCAELPPEVRQKIPYSDPADPDHVFLYKYADLDTIVELFGHIRAVNPTTSVRYRITSDVTSTEYTTHVVLVGGVDWNDATKEFLTRTGRLPVRQVGREEESDIGYFETDGPDAGRFEPVIRDGVLVEDIALFYRGTNPLNRKRTMTICSGMFARGTFGAARALTDWRFRDRNAAYLSERFGDTDEFCVLTRVPIMNNLAVTPDWSLQQNRLYEWSRDGRPGSA